MISVRESEWIRTHVGEDQTHDIRVAISSSNGASRSGWFVGVGQCCVRMLAVAYNPSAPHSHAEAHAAVPRSGETLSPRPRPQIRRNKNFKGSFDAWKKDVGDLLGFNNEVTS